ALYGDDLLTITQSMPACLVRLTREFGVKEVWPLSCVKDGHSIAVYQEMIYIASTGSDAIVKFEPGRGESIFWQGGPGDRDTIHVNSICWYQNQLYASIFGPKK